MLSSTMEDYLKTIYYLQTESDNERIRTSQVADYLDLTQPTVSSMLETLEEQGLIDRKKYHGVHLTEQGERVALEVIRHHRLLEAYLTTELDYDWADVHEEADRLEHHISEELERRLVDALGNPEIDPHGAPIPTADLDLPNAPTGSPIAGFDVGQALVIEEVSDRDPDVLNYLAEHGIEPGVEVTITEVAPFGMVTLVPQSGTNPVSLPEEIAQSVRARVIAEAKN